MKLILCKSVVQSCAVGHYTVELAVWFCGRTAPAIIAPTTAIYFLGWFPRKVGQSLHFRCKKFSVIIAQLKLKVSDREVNPRRM